MARKTIEELEKFHIEQLKKIKEKKEKKQLKRLNPYFNLIKKYSKEISDKDLEVMTNYVVNRFSKKR